VSRDCKLEPILRSVDPGIRLVTERHLRKVWNYLSDRGWSLPSNPDLPIRVPREVLLAADVLPEEVTSGNEPELLLITDPNDRMIDSLATEVQLRVYWRVIYAEAVAREVANRHKQDGVSDDEWLRGRFAVLGAAAVREARHVLESEHLLSVDADDATLYRTLAAAYLAVHHFECHRLEDLFPSLPPPPVVIRLLAADVDAEGLLGRTKPPGAAQPPSDPVSDSEIHRGTYSALAAQPATSRQNRQLTALVARARAAEGCGNHVRVAILQTQIARQSSGDEQVRATEQAEAALSCLVAELGRQFGWKDDTRREWHEALKPLLHAAAVGVWPRAARSLAELQRIATDLSRTVYAVDLAVFLLTFGRRPIRRPLPHAQPVRVLMALKQAHSQMLRAGLSHASRHRLDTFLRQQIQQTEHAIRERFTPIIRDSLSRAGLHPQNRAEEVSGNKLVAELLDRICERGYLRIGDLRDAIARNRLKLPDLALPDELLWGDQLLRADKNLADSLDGVYRRGEVYLRFIQRLSALFFGTALGRLFTRFVALPFGGSFLVLMFLEEMRHILGRFLAFLSRSDPRQIVNTTPATTPGGNPADDHVLAPDDVTLNDDGRIYIPPLERVSDIGSALTPIGRPVSPVEHPPSWLIEPMTIISFGLFLLLVLHVPSFRQVVVNVLGRLGNLMLRVFWDWPIAVWRSPTLRAIRQSRGVRFLVRHFWNPLLISLLALAALLLVGIQPWFLRRWWWAVCAGLTLAYNTPWGWVIQDRIAEAISDWWRVIRVNLLPGLVATIIDWFRTLVGWVERQLYAVDEWLRFRGGDSRVSLAVKATLGLFWLPLAYVFRFAFNLLVEPQINPIKHFPVVTVSHKMMLPLVIYQPGQAEPTVLGKILVDQLAWSVDKANFWAFWCIAAIPGVFGFIAWELVANWQMYRANRSTRLRPVMIGSHGETMRGLLRPGFHSGTVPKLFRKLRRARPDKVARWHHELGHITEAIERFVGRELLSLLNRDPRWGDVELRVRRIRLGCQRVVIELLAGSLGPEPVSIAIENIKGVIVATQESRGWIEHLSPTQQEVFTAALAGFLDMAAVDRWGSQDRSDPPDTRQTDTRQTASLATLTRPVRWREWVEFWDLRSPETNAINGRPSRVGLLH
jgi:hypothetical protein